MNGTRSRRGVLIPLGLLAAILIALLAVRIGNGDTSTAQAALEARQKCVEAMHFYAYDAPKASRQFGPNQVTEKTTLKAVVDRDVLKLGKDPLYAASILQTADKGKDVVTETVETTTKSYIDNCEEWRSDVKTYLDSVSKRELVTMSQHYETLGMIVTGKDRKVMPRLIKASPDRSVGLALKTTFKNGKVLYQRVACDGQPAVPTFVHVTKTPKEAPPVRIPTAPKPPRQAIIRSPKPTKSTTSTTTPPSTTTTTAPQPTPSTTTKPPTTKPPTTTPPSTTTPPTTTTSTGKQQSEAPKPPQVPVTTGPAPRAAATTSTTAAATSSTTTEPGKGSAGPGATSTTTAPPTSTTAPAPPVTVAPTSAPPMP